MICRPRTRHRIAAVVLAAVSTSVIARAQEGEQADLNSSERAAISADPTLDLINLGLLIEPLTKDELLVEADAWIDLLREKVRTTNNAEIQLRRVNMQIAAAGEVGEVDAETGEVPPAPAEVADAADEELPSLEQLNEQKAQLIERLNTLRTERTALVDRVNRVLAEVEKKGGDTDEYEKYVNAVSGIKLDVSDAAAAWAAFLGWLTSPEGGIRLGFNTLKFLLTLIAFWIIASILGRAAERAIRRSPRFSGLLKDFIRRAVRRVTVFVGLLVALSMLEIELGPVLAVIGAAGFVVAFALQGSLSNFASGLLILAYRPFDVGDVVNVADVSGKVESMNLVSTVLLTFDNQRMIVPNNSIWNDVITNITGLPTRRVDMVFGIAYEDDTDKAMNVLREVVESHELVLKEPEPAIKLNELADSSVNFICRPWTKTADYWTVYWDLMNAVKRRFDAEGITIPFPQRDVHVHTVGDNKEA